MMQHRRHSTLELIMPSSTHPPHLDAVPLLAGRRQAAPQPTARKARSSDVLDMLERGGQPSPEQLFVDGCLAAVRLTADGIEWTATGGGFCWRAPASGTVPFGEMLCARAMPPTTRSLLPFWRTEPRHRLEILTFQRGGRRCCEWAPRRLVLGTEDEERLQDWAAALTAGIEASSAGRPRRLLVLLNPLSGHRQGRRLYRNIVAPVFEAAGIETTVWETGCGGDAREMVAQLSLSTASRIDGEGAGLVCVGGDGIFHEAVNGLMLARAAAAAAEQAELLSVLEQLRLAHIPAGSTDAVACSLHESRSVFTAAVHICLGDCLPLDVLQVDTSAGTKFAACIAAYGFLADVTRGAERYRWLGPLRYDLVGALRVLIGASYTARIRYLEGHMGRELSRHGHQVCLGSRCTICAAAAVAHCNRSQRHHFSTTTAARQEAGFARVSSSSGMEGAIAGLRHPDAPADALAHTLEAARPAPAAAGLPPSSAPPMQHCSLLPAFGNGQGPGDEMWRELSGRWASIMLLSMPCRSDKTRAGMVRHGHLADGRLKLVLVRQCTPLQYLRFLLYMSRRGCAPGDLSFVEVLDAVAVQVQPAGSTSAWNLDGECIVGPDMAIAAQTHHGLVRVFARGPEA